MNNAAVHRLLSLLLQFVMCMRVLVLDETMVVIATALIKMHGWSV